MSTIILAVGGTGQVLVHYYLQMYCLGIAEAPIRAIVLDTDSYSKSLATFEAYFDLLREAGYPEELPSLRFAKLEETKGAGARIHDVMGAKDIHTTGYHHPLQAFFSRELLSMPATEGLYSRPAASSLLAPDAARLLKEEDFAQDTDVILAASTIGGTGAGLSIQLMCRAQEIGRSINGIRLKAVLLGEYFVPDDAKLAGATIRFRSNKTWFLKSLEHAVPSILRYAWIDPDTAQDKLSRRDANAELDTPNLPWCEERHAFWQGLKAMLFLMEDRTSMAEKFADREVPPNQYESKAKRPNVEQNLRKSLGRAQALIRQNVARRLGFEATPARVWEGRLTKFMSGSIQALTRGSNGSEGAPAKYCGAIQEQMKLWWQVGDGNRFPLQGLFPHMPPERPSVTAMRNVTWAPPPTDWGNEVFRNRDSAASVSAAALLDCALRKGKLA